jgi:hypothetical protein
VELDDLLAALVDEAGDVEELGDGELTRNNAPFASKISNEAIEIRLGAEIAEAARRTPDTSASARGDAWVRFAPREWNEHAADRLEAWFRVAWRMAGEG